MKIPEARKLPSGSWFVRVVIDGKRISITKPTKKEAEREAMALKSGVKRAKTKSGCTVNEAIDKYIAARATESPETIRGYRKIQRNRFQDTLHLDIYRITKDQWQDFINEEAKKISPKYLANSWHFFSSVIHEQTGERIKVIIPTVPPSDLNFLEPEEIPLFVKQIEGDSCEIQILLALHSLRKSEILDITWNDIDLKHNLIKVRGAAVFDEHNKLVHKDSNKNQTSTRMIPIMIPRLRTVVSEADKSSTYIHQGDPNKIYRHVVKACNKAEVTQCSLHDLRRTFASLCYHLRISEMTCQKLGGWKDREILHAVYVKLSQQDFTDEIQRIQNFYLNGNENGNGL